MRIGGFEPFSLCDYPSRVAAVVFTQGCNFRCPFCHNGHLIPMVRSDGESMTAESVMHYLRSRRGMLDGVVVSGGEPTLQEELPSLLGALKELGFATKLDTNGSRPETLRSLLREGLLDFVAMDLKAPLPMYGRLSGGAVDLAAIQESIALIAGSGVDHQFRTTVIESLLSPADLQAIRDLVPQGSPYRLQPFRAPGRSGGKPW